VETTSDNVTESGLAAKVPRISIEELRQKMDSGVDILLVDTRKPEEYAKDRIKGAISVPLDVIVAGQWLPAIDKDIILY
jgi:rhodanese-related sulfurtransferase